MDCRVKALYEDEGLESVLPRICDCGDFLSLGMRVKMAMMECIHLLQDIRTESIEYFELFAVDTPWALQLLTVYDELVAA